MCEFVCVLVCETGPVRLRMNGLPHWEQQELFLVLASIAELVAGCSTTKDLREQITNSSVTPSAG